MADAPTQDLILEAIRSKGPMTADECAKVIDKGLHNVRDRIRWMVLAGKLVRISRGLYATPVQAEAFGKLAGMEAKEEYPQDEPEEPPG